MDIQIVRHIARLARLRLTDEEAAIFAGQLQQILDYFEMLQQLDYRGEPFSYHRRIPPVTRPDQPLASLPVEDALRDAPESVKRFFKVPRILP